MSLSADYRRDRGADDDLSLDEPSVPAWRAPRRVEEPAAQPAPAPAPQPIEVRQVRRGPDPIGTLSSLVGLGVKLTALLILLAFLWVCAGLIGFGGHATSGVGAQISSAIERGSSAAATAGQRVADAFDRAHPPRDALTQDTEIDELLRVNIGSPIPGTTTRVVTVSSVQRRAGADSSDMALYAVLHSELRQPQETKVLGVTVRSTTEPRDDYVYKGETIRVGPKLFKVNWISADRKQVALIAYRDQDHVAAPVKAAFD